MIRSSPFVLAAALMLIAAPGYADDLMPPPFRGQPNSIFVEFDRADAISPLERIGQQVAPNSFPLYTGDPDGPTGPIQPGGDAQIIGMMQFTMPDGEKYDIYVPNVVDDLPLKLVQIQITYSVPQGQQPGPSSVGILDAAPFADGFMDSVFQQVITPLGGEPTIFYEKWSGEIIPNPDWEIFQIQVPGSLDQVVIDTISIGVPTPSAAIAGVGLLGVLAARRRR